jgi:hypothetical protein
MGCCFLNETLRHGLSLSEKVGLILVPVSTWRLAEAKRYRPVLVSVFGADMAVGSGMSKALCRSLASLKWPRFR